MRVLAFDLKLQVLAIYDKNRDERKFKFTSPEIWLT